MTLDVLKSEALKLKRAELFEFTKFLIDAIKVKEGGGSNVSDTELSPEWKEEIQRRWKEIESGEAELFTLDQIQAELNKEFGFDITVSQ
ncbi:MAG: addiction module protein [Lewinellaceae bacterium]|nr:addiction module protein [Saprospiraceae bacterium]MCB9341150.1 addiction module protein [Lewinellaceae bacterium]